MTTEAFRPITRAMAREILEVSLGTLDQHIRDGDLPKPRPLGNGRKLYWLPGEFYGALRHGLAPPGATQLGAKASDKLDAEEVASATAAPRTVRPTESAVAREARRTKARLKRLNE